MRLATFNLLHGMPIVGGGPSMPRDAEGRPTGPPEHTDDTELREAVRRLQADVIGLQEVDRHQTRSGGFDQTAVVAETLEAEHFLFAPSVLGTPGSPQGWEPADHEHDLLPQDTAFHGPLYGVGLVSRLPVSRWEVFRFAAAPASIPLLVPAQPRPQLVKVADEPRAAIAAVIEGEQGPFTVVTAHLSFIPGFNVRQLRALRHRTAHLPRPLFLTGDFNLPGKLPRRLTGFRSLASGPTYPSTGPKVQFDHLLADGLPETTRTVATVHSLPVSDHCAVTVDLTPAP
jgi:endonuclease/exonuclease/phosphatase family metal-dependent hydrolase